jgi:hypothetical protein
MKRALWEIWRAPSFVPRMVTEPLSIAFGAGDDDAGEESMVGALERTAPGTNTVDPLTVELQKIFQSLRNQANLPKQGTSMQCTVAITMFAKARMMHGNTKATLVVIGNSRVHDGEDFDRLRLLVETTIRHTHCNDTLQQNRP